MLKNNNQKSELWKSCLFQYLIICFDSILMRISKKRWNKCGCDISTNEFAKRYCIEILRQRIIAIQFTRRHVNLAKFLLHSIFLNSYARFAFAVEKKAKMNGISSVKMHVYTEYKTEDCCVIESPYCNEYKMKFCPNSIFKAHFFPLKPYTNNLYKI